MKYVLWALGAFIAYKVFFSASAAAASSPFDGPSSGIPLGMGFNPYGTGGQQFSMPGTRPVTLNTGWAYLLGGSSSMPAPPPTVGPLAVALSGRGHF